MVSFEPLLRRQHYSPNVNNCVYSMFDQKVTGGSWDQVGSLSPGKHLIGFEPETFQFICDPSVENPQVEVFKMLLIDNLRFSNI